MERELTRLKLDFRNRKKFRTLKPNYLYRRYQDYTPLLPNDTNEWLFHLVVLFLNALSIYLKESVVFGEYKLPTFNSLSTQVIQQQKLELLREVTVKAQRSMEEGEKRIRAMLPTFTPSHKSGNTLNILSHNLSRNLILYHFLK